MVLIELLATCFTQHGVHPVYVPIELLAIQHGVHPVCPHRAITQHDVDQCPHRAALPSMVLIEFVSQTSYCQHDQPREILIQSVST